MKWISVQQRQKHIFAVSSAEQILSVETLKIKKWAKKLEILIESSFVASFCKNL